MGHLSLLWCTLATGVVAVQSLAASWSPWTSTPFTPSAWPLAVKSPYLNSWYAGGANAWILGITTPAFWPGWDDQTMWVLTIVVDDIPYRIMGPGDINGLPSVANQTTITFTSTKTAFTFIAGPMEVNVTFLSPVTPNDLTRQSMPFTYLYVDVSSTDGATHDVRLYSDVSPQWLHGSRVLLPDTSPKVSANASLINSKDFVGLQMLLQEPQPFVEVVEHAQDVIGVFAMKFDPAIKYQVGVDVTVRALGYNSTGLQNTIDTNYSSHALDSPFDAYAISIDLGAIQSTSKSLMWTIGMLRDPSINLTTASGANQLRSSYYWSNFSTIPDIIAFVLNDFDSARLSSSAFDQMIQDVLLSHIPGYADLLAYAIRQVFGTLEISISKTNDGIWNQSDVMIFSKDMGDVGSTGSSGGSNVVDVLYSGFPALLYLNPQLCRYLLRPILESQVVNGAPMVGLQPYPPKHLGNQFTNVSSDTSPHNLGIEQSGNMLIMVLAHMQKADDLSIAQNYYTLLKSWADYLTNETLNAGFQTTSISDGITSFNQTNLVLKGIIGISAMGFISGALGESDDQAKYQKFADQYMQIWLNGSLSQDQSSLLSSFGDPTSKGLIYNMYADKMLGLNLIPSKIFEIQLGYYESLLSLNRTPFGIPLDNGNSSLSRLDWTMFAAASILEDGGASAPAVFQQTVAVLMNYAGSQALNNSPPAIIYNPENGEPYSGFASFAIGSLFAPLLIGGKNSTNSTSNQDSQAKTHKAALGPIPAGIIGGVCGLIALGLVIYIWSRRSRDRTTGGGYPTAIPQSLTAQGHISSIARLSTPVQESKAPISTPPESPPPQYETSTFNSSSLLTSPSSSDSQAGDRLPPLAELVMEIWRARNEVRNRRFARDEGDSEIEALPPSYVGDFL